MLLYPLVAAQAVMFFVKGESCDNCEFWFYVWGEVGSKDHRSVVKYFKYCVNTRINYSVNYGVNRGDDDKVGRGVYGTVRNLKLEYVWRLMTVNIEVMLEVFVILLAGPLVVK